MKGIDERMKKFLKSLTVLLALIVTLAACSGGAQNGKKEFRLAIERAMTTLNHQVTTSRAEMEQISQVMEGLTRYDKNKKLSASGAESWEISDDYLTYTFKLRKDAKWTNGEPVTAHDYVFAWKTLLLNPKAGYNYVLTILENGPAVKAGEKQPEELGVKAIDDYTFEVKITQPYAPFLDAVSTVTYYPLNEKAYNEIGEEAYGTSAETIMTNGAFTLSKYDAASLLEFTKSEEYWDKKNVALEKVTVKIVSELSTQSVMYDNNELDILRITGSLTDQYKDDQYTVTELESRIIYMYLSGTTATPDVLLGNANFRQAIARVLDKEVIAENILKDGSKPLEGLIPAGFGDVKNKDFRQFAGTYNEKTQDISAAKELLAKAQAELPAGTPLVINIAVQESATFKKVFENVKSQIESALPDVTVNLETVPNQLYFAQVMKKATPAGVGSWSAAFTDYFNFMELFTAGATFNYADYNNPEFGALVDEARIEGDAVKQAELYAKAEKILVEDAVYIPLYQVGAKYQLKPHVKGFVLNQVAPSIDYKLLDIA